MKISQALWFFVCLTIIALAVIGGGQQPDYSKTVTLTPVAPDDQFTPTLAPQEMAIYNVTINRTGTKDGIAYELDEDLDPNPSVTKNPAADPNLLWVWNDQAGGGGNNPNYEFKIVNTIWDEKTVTVTVKCTWVPVPVPGDGNGGEGEVPDPIHGKAEGIALHQWGALVPTSDIAVDGAPDYLCINEMITLSSWLVLDEFEYEDPELIESNWRVEGLAPSYGGGTIEPNPDHTVVFTPTNTGIVRVTATESLYSTNSGTVEFTIVEVEITTEDEPENLICVGGTKEYTAAVTPTNVQGTFTWSVGDTNQMDIVGANNQQTVTVTGKQASASMNAEELTVEFTVNGEMICEPSTNLTIINVEFLDKNYNETASLNVGKWENSFETDGSLKDEFIGPDDDRFYIRVTDASKKGDGTISISLSTDSPGSAYDDDETEIELTEDPADSGSFISKSKLLVSDNVDDNHTTSEVVADDRTHIVALDGVVKVKYPANGSAICEMEVTVPSTFTQNIIAIIMRNKAEADGGTPLVDYDDVETQMKAVAERYAQVGYNLTWTIRTEDPPASVDLEQGELYMGDSIGTEGEAVLGAECKALIDAYPNSSIFYVGHLVWEYDENAAWAIADYWYAESEAAYVGRAVISARASKPALVAAHEIGHLYGDDGYVGVPDWHLMAHQNDWEEALNNDCVTDQKRWRDGDL